MRQVKGYRLVVTIVALFALAGSQLTAMVGQTPGLLKMKAGQCTFSLLDSDGVKPMKGSTLQLSAAEDGHSVVKMKADTAGKCVLDLAAGRYILTVDGKHLAIVDAATTATIAECRVIVPEKGVLVGGAEGDVPTGAESEEARRGLIAGLLGGGGTRAVVIGGVVVLVAGGTYAIIENNNDSGDSSGPASL